MIRVVHVHFFSILRLSVFYFVSFLHYSCSSRFNTSLLDDQGFSAGRIGIMYGLIRIMSCFVGPSISAWADGTKKHRIAYLILLMTRNVPYLVIGAFYATGSLTYGIVFLCLATFSFLSSPLNPLADSLAINALGDSSKYGKVRLWGALSYGLMNLFLGYLIWQFSSYAPVFICFAITSVACSFSARVSLPPQASASEAGKIDFTKVWGIVFHSTASWVFFLNMIVIGAAMSLVENLLFLTMARDMTNSSTVIGGASVLISVLFELPIFQIAPSLIHRWGTRRMIAVGQLCWILRSLGYALSGSAYVTLGLELFHGITFGLVWSAAMHVIVQMCPAGMESTLQSLLDITYGGIGQSLGVVVGGLLLDSVGSSATYSLFATAVFASMAAFLLLTPEAPPAAQLGVEKSPVAVGRAGLEPEDETATLIA